MARKKDWSYWSNGLHQESTGLADITQLAEDRGVDRSVIDREILLAWSEARHGQTSAYGGVLFSPLAPAMAPALAQPSIPRTPPVPPTPRKETVSSSQKTVGRGVRAAVAHLDFDDDL
jgi:hypothetical protein